jgi:hypothetical protein
VTSLSFNSRICSAVKVTGWLGNGMGKSLRKF